MNYITTTELRTKSKQLIKALDEGKTVKLIHRSKVVGVVKPETDVPIMTKESIEVIKKAAQKLNLPKISYKERKKIYRKHLMEKYGKGIS